AGQVVALTGQPTGHHLLERVVAGSGAELLAGLSLAVDHHVLVHDGEAYEFRHALVAEAVAQHMLPGERIELHRRVAQALSARLPGRGGAARLAQIAHHWLACGDAERALVATVDAALAAEEVMALPQARLHYGHAMARWGDAPAARHPVRLVTVDLCANAAEIAFRLDDLDAALGLADQGLAHLDGQPDRQRAGVLHGQRGRYLLGRCHQRGSTLAECERAVRLVPPQASEARAEVLDGLAITLLMDTRFAEAHAYAMKPVEVARQIGSRERESHGLGTLGVSQAMLGRPEDGLANLRSALE